MFSECTPVNTWSDMLQLGAYLWALHSMGCNTCYCLMPDIMVLSNIHSLMMDVIECHINLNAMVSLRDATIGYPHRVRFSCQGYSNYLFVKPRF